MVLLNSCLHLLELFLFNIVAASIIKNFFYVSPNKLVLLEAWLAYSSTKKRVNAHKYLLFVREQFPN